MAGLHGRRRPVATGDPSDRNLGISFGGSCLGGAVAYKVDRIEGPVMHCHCNTCRKAYAAAYGRFRGQVSGTLY